MERRWGGRLKLQGGGWFHFQPLNRTGFQNRSGPGFYRGLWWKSCFGKYKRALSLVLYFGLGGELTERLAAQWLKAVL